MIGDPSFKDKSRKLLGADDIERNLDGIRRSFTSYLDFDGPAKMVNNADWLLDLNYVEFLRDVGRHFSVNRMLSFDSVKLRLGREQSLSFLEFNYMILQAFDFTELYRREGCQVQLGGSDQWGNIVNGIDLGRRMTGANLFAITSPLLTTSSGAKMGKTAAGAVWLNPDMLSAYDFWQYWRNTEDADVGRFLRLYTTLCLDEIAKLEALGGTEINEAKRLLATKVTELLHGVEAAQAAAEIARVTFATQGTSEDLPSQAINGLDQGIGLLSLIVALGFAKSNGEARRHVRGGAIKINDQAQSNEQAVVGADEMVHDGAVKVSFGKKKHILAKAGN